MLCPFLCLSAFSFSFFFPFLLSSTQVKDIGFTGVFRLIFKPLVAEFPCFGAVCCSLRQKVQYLFSSVRIFYFYFIVFWGDGVEYFTRLLFEYKMSSLLITAIH